jgi:hypothetical protein
MQVSARKSRSTAGWATMQRVFAGVAQLAEQPSCKRQASGSNPLTGSQVKHDFASLRSGGTGLSAAKSAAKALHQTVADHSKIALAAASIASRSISGSTCV